MALAPTAPFNRATVCFVPAQLIETSDVRISNLFLLNVETVDVGSESYSGVATRMHFGRRFTSQCTTTAITNLTAITIVGSQPEFTCCCRKVFAAASRPEMGNGRFCPHSRPRTTRQPRGRSECRQCGRRMQEREGRAKVRYGPNADSA